MSVKRRILGPPVPKLPLGLVDLMDGLARDVLKHNPENIYEFCARHMQTLLEIRDGRALKPIMTLDQKIENAQQKVRQRAEERRLAFDKMITEDANQEKMLSAAGISRCGDDSELYEKKKTEINHSDIQPEVKEEIKEVLEKLEQIHVNKAVVFSELKNETDDPNDVSNDDVDKELEEKNENIANPNILTDIEWDKNEKNNVSTENEAQRDDNNKDNSDINNLLTENNSIENNQLNEAQPETVSDINTQCAADSSLPHGRTLKLENDHNTEEKILSSENNESNLHSEIAEIIQNKAGTEPYENQTKMDTSSENHSSDTTDRPLENPEDISHYEINLEQNEKQVDPVSKNNSIDGNVSETTLNTEENHKVTNKHIANFIESEKSPDGHILNVILNSDNTENIPLQNKKSDIKSTDLSTEVNGNVDIKLVEDLKQSEKSDDHILNVILSSDNTATVPQANELVNISCNELDSAQVIITQSVPNEVEMKSEQITDIVSVPESVNDNDKINNINSSMDLETAAITIQKVFRSFLFKTKTASYDDPTTVDITLLTEDKEKEDNEIPNIKDRRHLGINRMDTVLQTVNEEKSLSLSTDDSSTLSSAATIIQAHVRGFLVRNKMNLNKTISSNSLIDSDAPSIPSLEADSDNIKNKTILNIHIVPEGGHFVSRDESILTSMDLSLDSSPPSSVNLHPLGYDKSVRRKQLKREDAIQSVSPPSNNSGKLSEEHDSVKELLTIESNAVPEQTFLDKTLTEGNVLEKEKVKVDEENDSNIENPTSNISSDEMDVVTPFAEGRSSRESNNSTKLIHSGEFHDVVVPTSVTRSDASVVRGE